MSHGGAVEVLPLPYLHRAVFHPLPRLDHRQVLTPLVPVVTPRTSVCGHPSSSWHAIVSLLARHC
jgi:hypothetical protein